MATNGTQAPAAVPQPHNLEAEQSVLGAILLSDVTLYGLVIDSGLRPEDFYRERHAAIYEAMLDLYQQSEPVDILTVTEQLRRSDKLEDVGGAAAVEALSGMVPSAGNVEYYARIVKDNSLLRRLLIASYEIQSSVAGNEGSPQELVERAEQRMFEVAHDESSKDFETLDRVLGREITKLEELSKHGSSITGLATGFKDLDAITAGFQPGNLLILAARPSMGKSAIAINMAEHIALRERKAVALFSLEMSESEIAQRFLASQSGVKGEELRRGKVPDAKWPHVMKASKELAAAPVFIDDSSDIGILEIRAKARRLHSQESARGGLGMVIVDYMQLMRADGRIDSRVEAVGQMSRGLKILARELNIPVMALSQLNRGPEARPDKRPMLSDLRESGQIEQDADLVMFIYRDEVYDPESEDKGYAELIIAKHRNGPLDTVKLVFLPDYPRFRTANRARDLV